MNKIKHSKIISATILSFIITLTGYLKSSAQPDNLNNSSSHNVDSKLVGTWMWTESADGAYYNDNGTYQGPAYGLAIEYKINADGSGTCFNHFTSTIGAGTSFTVDISSKGFFESDNQQHLGYFPISGTYKTSKGTNRSLAGDELWDNSTNTGKNFLYQKLEFKTINGRQCFEVTSSDNITDRYWKVE